MISKKFREIGHIYLLELLLKENGMLSLEEIKVSLLESREVTRDAGELGMLLLELLQYVVYGIMNMDCLWHL